MYNVVFHVVWSAFDFYSGLVHLIGAFVPTRICDEPKHNTFGVKKLGCIVSKTSREKNNPLTDLIFSL
jgi:hypothetical protein